MESATSSQPDQPKKKSDLRAELFDDLSARFALELNSIGSLPNATQHALIELLGSDAPTEAEIIAAISKSDPFEEEISHE